MSVARGFGLNGKSIYMNVAKPTVVWCNFVVDSANGNGLGIRSPKSNGYIDAIFMHTSTTPGSMNGKLNPNPAAGYASIIFKNNFNYYLGGFNGQIIPTTSNTTSSLTAGSVYVITVLGNTTLANWQLAGLPAGITPAVGVSFVSILTGSITGTGKVGVPGVPLATTVTVVGDPNASIANASIASNGGARIIVQFSAPTLTTGAYVSPIIPTSPTDNSVVGMQFNFDASTVTIDGL